MKWIPLSVSAPGLYTGDTEMICVPVYLGEVKKTAGYSEWDKRLLAEAERTGFDGGSGSLEVNEGDSRFCLLGLGPRPDDSHSTRQHMHVAGTCVKHAIQERVATLCILAHASSPERAAAMVRDMTIGANLAMPRDTQKTVGVTTPRLESVRLCFVNSEDENMNPADAHEDGTAPGFPLGSDGVRALIADATMLARAVRLARFWVDLGPNQKTPESFVDRVRVIYEEVTLDVKPERYHGTAGYLPPIEFGFEELDENKLTDLGMNLVLAVGGCHHEDHDVPESLQPRLLHIYRKADSPNGDKPLAFVLKCVLFDSGGLQIKDADGMRHMKNDMAAGGVGG